jgi:peptide/nickel transport system permease protein
MTQYIIRRLLILPIVLFGMTVLIFAMLQMLSPAERATLYVTSGTVLKNPAALQQIIHQYGLDQPIYMQYVRWLNQVLHGHLGWSQSAQMPVEQALAIYFPATLELTLWSVVPIIIIGIWAGIQAALHHDRVVDHLARLFSIFGYSFPTFVVALILLMVFYASLQWFPPGRLSDWASAIVYSPAFHRYTGMNTLDALFNGRPDIFADALRHIVLPAFTLIYVTVALILRVMRSSMLDVIRQDYITVARSKGLPEKLVVNRHGRPNALIPVVTISGLLIAGLLNGVVITETVFNYHGMGWWSANAALSFDAVSVLGVTLVAGVLIILANLIVDIMYAYLDPRIRLG